jgi:hypothetical protein
MQWTFQRANIEKEHKRNSISFGENLHYEKLSFFPKQIIVLPKLIGPKPPPTPESGLG